MRIWVDADACPRDVKDIVFRASERLRVPVCLVANRDLKIPHSEFVTKFVVPRGLDMADHHIVAEVSSQDLVITADIPLASAVVDKGAFALDPRGELYTEANVKERLAMRDLMQELRSSGTVQGGPAGYSQADKQRFADAFDRLLTRLISSSR